MSRLPEFEYPGTAASEGMVRKRLAERPRRHLRKVRHADGERRRPRNAEADDRQDLLEYITKGGSRFNGVLPGDDKPRTCFDDFRPRT